MPQRAKHVGDKDAAGFQPDIAVVLTGLGDKLVRDAVGIGGVSDFIERRPERAAGIEWIQDDVAALGLIIMRDELAAGIIDQGGFAPRLNAIKYLAKRSGLAAAGGADHCHMPGLKPVGQGDAANM